MPYSFACPCGTKLSVGENLVGKAVKCPKCAKVMKVPAPVGAGASTAVAAPPAPKPAAPGAPGTPMPRMELPPSPGKPPSKQSPAVMPKAPAPKAAAPKPPAPPAPKPAPPKAASRPPSTPAIDEVEIVDDVEEVAAPPARKGPPAVLGLKAAPPAVSEIQESPLEEVEEVDDARGGYAGVGRKIQGISKPSLEEDSPVPDHMRERIHEELTKGERLIWVGQPSHRIIWIRTIPLMIGTGLVGLFAGGFMLISGYQAYSHGGGVGFLLMGLFVLLIILASVIFQPIYALWKAKRTCYALTSRRCIVWRCQWHGGIATDNYTPGQLANMRRFDMWFFSKGGGDVVFKIVTVITTTYRSRGPSSTSVTEYRYGFLAVERCRDVEKLIRETLLDRLLDKLNA
jgi:hypothetical protein